MTSACRLLGLLPLLTTLACQPAEGSATADLASRLEATEERLAAIESKLDAIGSALEDTNAKLEPLQLWAVTAGKKEQERAARRKSLDERREQRALRREERGALLSGGESSPEDAPLEGFSEGIHCTGLGSAAVECRFDRALLEEILDDPARLAKQARVVPSVRDGKSQGYKFYGIRRGSLPKQVGIKNGDLLRSAGGRPLDSIDDAMAAYTELRSATEVEFQFERKGTPYSLKIAIEE